MDRRTERVGNSLSVGQRFSAKTKIYGPSVGELLHPSFEKILAFKKVYCSLNQFHVVPKMLCVLCY